MTDKQILKNIIDSLINRGDITNVNDLAKKLGKASGNIYKVLGGERKIPASMKLALHKLYQVSTEYVSNGTGEIFEEKKTATDFDIPQIKSLESKIQNLENELRFRDEIIKNKDAVIQTQAMTIKALQIALNNK